MGDATKARLTGLFQSKNKRNVFSGTLREKDLDGLKDVIREARAKNTEVAFFVWDNGRNEDPHSPRFALSCGVAEKRGGKKRRRKRDDYDDDDYDRDDDRDEGKDDDGFDEDDF